MSGLTMQWRGVWDSATPYKPGDTVFYGGNSYTSILSGTSKQPDTNPTYWDIMGIPNMPGPAGPQGPKGDPGPAVRNPQGAMQAFAGVLHAFVVMVDPHEQIWVSYKREGGWSVWEKVTKLPWI